MFGPNAAGSFAFYPAWTYWVLAALTAAAVAGLAIWSVSRTSQDLWQRRALLVPALLGALVLASFVRFNMTFFQAQGRYLFPALPFWALLFVVGLGQLVPPRARPWSALALAAAMLLLALGGFLVIGSLPVA